MNQMEENNIKPFSVTLAGFIVPMFTGLLSACSSGLIIYIISKSPQKLSTTHHRIMAFMSVFDIIASIFIALGTIMMPTDNVFDFEGPMLGNKVTCQIQGWFVIFGSSGGASLFMCLSCYFVCKLTFKVNSERIRSCFEPIMYAYAVFVSLFSASYYLSKDLLHPDPSHTHCTIAPYPISCDESVWIWPLCEWDPDDRKELNKDFTIMKDIVPIALAVIFNFILILIFTLIILKTAYDSHQNVKAALIEAQRHDNRKDDGIFYNNEDDIRTNIHILEQLRYSRVTSIQALMYIASFLITWIFSVADTGYGKYNHYMDALNAAFFPMQGFWNMIIFAYDKVYLVYQMNECDTYWNALKIVLLAPDQIIDAIILNKNFALESAQDENSFSGDMDGRPMSPKGFCLQSIDNENESSLVPSEFRSLEDMFHDDQRNHTLSEVQEGTISVVV
jgi:MFS family permease